MAKTPNEIAAILVRKRNIHSLASCRCTWKNGDLAAPFDEHGEQAFVSCVSSVPIEVAGSHLPQQ